MKRLTYLLLCFFISIGVATAQTTKVTGSVTSADDGEPVIGASIVVKGTTVGTVTTFDGTFSLDVPQNASTLVISYIGMIAQELPVSPNMRVVLRSDTQALDEVVVTAMGISREKKSLGYALQEVKSDEITKAGQMNVATSLSGKVAGLQITSQGGQVGASANIVIRGNSSFGNNEPLIVVDGVPIINDNPTGATANLGSGLNDINPNDIESISVLKGGSAALYGMRAGNGVILITTKQGRKDKGVVVSYDGDFTFDKVYGLPKFQDKYGQGYYGSEFDWKNGRYSDLSYQDFASQHGYGYVDGKGSGVNDNADESWGPRLDIGLQLPQFNSPVVDGVRQATPWVSNPNNIKDFFETGHSTSHTIGVSSTSENAVTRASISYRNQEGTTPNTDQTRYGASINSQFKINKYFDFDVSANYIRTTSDNLPGTGYNATNALQSLMQWFGRQVNMKDLKSNWDQRDASGQYTHYNWQGEYASNPYWILNKNTTQLKRDRVYGKASLWYKPTDWLKFEGRLGLDHNNNNQLSVRSWDTDYPQGYFRDFNRRTTEINADFIAYFNKQVEDFNINALAGANYRDYDYQISGIGGDNLTVPELYTVANVIGMPYTHMDHQLRRSNSVYANASIGWKNQLYVDVSVRNDWDSTIEDSFFYPSFSGSWILTETLPSITDSGWLNFMKIRGGWAKIGSATVPYRSGNYYETETSPKSMFGTTLYRNPTVYPPTGLRPEMVKTWEVGVEASFIQNRLRLDAAYYQKTTTDQIMEANIASPTGYTSMVINAGEISNKGLEVQLTADIFKNPKGFNWTATLNWSKDKSKIIELYTDPVTGQSLEAYRFYFNGFNASTYAMKGETWGSIVGTGYTYNDDGSILVKDGMPVAKSSQVVGDVTPDWLAGLHNEFTYKEWTVGFLLDFRKGGDIYSLSQGFGSYTGIYDYTAAGDIRENGVIVGKNVLTDKVFKDADGNINDVVVNAEDFFGNYYSIVEMAVMDGSYLKLREAYITYTFPKSLLAKTKYISGARVSLIGTNLALLWTHKSNLINLDPESTRASGNDGVGMESNSYPPSRSIGLKVGLTF
ncbi:SusC/RagA family TonB-linked outer membrane protein [Parabacteroides sp. PF5-9]|uniref:SusC/RagA family TonB-linked outer membrane protein n=1 Tax=Parabacteroides sp. PF5-9 TaxID=1742404 RepID=UPI002474DB69|nr:SusC/RagA family TonB-linked outer membrane protein [Parabacteroides sp. PF5-9]MDH6356812.1 TonB-linked SusC/RagA family outer membrane protein [Parabacteroides sp. PF5-9]